MIPDDTLIPDVPDSPDEDEDETPIEGYCVRCRAMVEIEDPQPVWTSKGAPGTRGVCPDCASTVFRMGMTDAHRTLTRPTAIRVEPLTKVATTGRKRTLPATYINHTAADASFAQNLAGALQQAGIHTWIESNEPSETPTPTIQWAAGVHPALNDSARMILILSSAALSDGKVSAAWGFFRQHKKPITIIVLAEAIIPDDLRRCPRIAFAEGDPRTQQKAFHELISALET